MKRFLLRADDLGYSEAVNYGIAKSVKEGVIKNVGLMPNMPFALHGINLLKDCDIALGQHTNISVGNPLSDPKRIPSLVNANGQFKSSSQYKAEGKDIVVQEEAEIEIEAQYRQFVHLTGKEPDYFEGHAVFSPAFFRALEEVANRHHLKYSGFSFDGKPIIIGTHPVECGFIPSMSAEYEPEHALLELMESADKDLTYLCVFHPGYLDDYLLRNSSLTINRTKEVEMLCSPTVKSFMKEHQIQSVDYREL